MSATGLVATTWQEVRKRPGTVVFSFWYLFIVVIFEYFSLSHLGPGFSSWVSRLTTTGVIPGLHGSLAVKLALVYLTFVLIVFPFSVAGLGGGVAAALCGKDTLNSLFSFFRHAVSNFWTSLGLIVSALVASVIVYLAIVVLLNLGSLDLVLAVVARLVALAVAVYWFALLFYWAGAVFAGAEPSLVGLRHALQWVIHNPWLALRVTVLVLVLMMVAAVIFAVVSQLPLFGSIISMIGSGIVLTLVATFAMLLYLNQS